MRAAPKHDVAFKKKQMMIRRGEVDLTVLDNHAALGLNHRKPACGTDDRRQNADSLSRDVQDDKHSRRQVGRQHAQDFLERSSSPLKSRR